MMNNEIIVKRVGIREYVEADKITICTSDKTRKQYAVVFVDDIFLIFPTYMNKSGTDEILIESLIDEAYAAVVEIDSKFFDVKEVQVSEFIASQIRELL